MAAPSAICALPGCSKSSFPSHDSRNPHITCGRTHHLLLMAARFHPDRPFPVHQQISDRNAAGFCALLCCTEPPEPDASWCSASHKLAWLFDFYLSLDCDQICRFPGCTRHVFVDENYLRGKFCGLRHEQKYVLQSALQRREQKAGMQKLQSNEPPPLESACGRVPSVESRINSFLHYGRCGIPPNDIKFDAEFFHKHPWDICNGGEIYWLIVPHQNTRNSRKSRVTIEDWHWKQRGKPVTKSNGSTLKYFVYEKLKGKKTDSGCSYFLDEYTIETVDNHVLVKLHKGSVRSRLCKRSKCTSIETHGKEDAQKIATWKDDEIAVDSFSSSLLSPPVLNDLEDDRGLNPEDDCCAGEDAQKIASWKDDEIDVDSFLSSLLSSPVLNDLEDDWSLNPEDDWGLNPCPGDVIDYNQQPILL